MVNRLQIPDTDDSTRVKQTDTNSSASVKADAHRIQRAIENPTPDSLTPDVVSQLQATHGNQFVNRLIQRMEDTSPESSLSYPVQAKMTVTAADDQYESEADAVAQQAVQAMRQPDIQREGEEEEELMMKRIQREGMEEEEELMMKRIQREGMEEEEELMMKRIQREDMDEEELMMKRIQRAEVGTEGGDISQELESEIESARGSGQRLGDVAPDIAQNMGESMGADFQDVKVHTGSQAADLNNAVQAKAFTTGSDVFFNSGQFNPDSSSGQELLAHELTHTVQQGAVPVQKKDDE